MQTCTFLRCILKCTHTGLNFVSCGHDHLHSDGKTWGTAQCNPMGGPQNSASGLWCCVSKWHFFPLANPGKKKKGVCPGAMKSCHIQIPSPGCAALPPTWSYLSEEVHLPKQKGCLQPALAWILLFWKESAWKSKTADGTIPTVL